MNKLTIIGLSTALFTTMPDTVWAQNSLGKWQTLAGMTSANIARTEGWKLVGTAGHSFPDGSQTLTTFWTDGASFLRCFAYFDIGMRQTGERCEQPLE